MGHRVARAVGERTLVEDDSVRAQLTTKGGARVGATLSARIAGVLAVIVGACVLFGWLAGVPALTSLTSQWPAMAPLTAMGLTLCGVSLWLATRHTARSPCITNTGLLCRPPLLLLISAGLGALATLLGVTRLATYIFGWNLQIDGLGLDGLALTRGMHPGATSPATAIGIASLGTALAGSARPQFARTYQAMALLALLIGWLGFARFVYGGAPLVPLGQMAIHTSVLLMVLAVGTLALHPDAGLTALFASHGAGGMSARRLLPAALIVPLAAGALSLYAERAGLLGPLQGFSLFTLSSVILFAVLVWGTASRLERADIERQRTQEALLESEERTRLIIDTALDAVITMNGAGVITGWSPQAESMFGWKAADAIGKPMSRTIIPERLRAAHEQGLRRYLETGEARILHRRIEITALNRGGDEFPVELAITPIRSRAGVTFSGFVRDITERKRSEKRLRSQFERLSLLDRMTRAIAERQDLRSILQVVVHSLEEHLPIDFGCACLFDSARQAFEVVCIGNKSRGLATQMALGENTRIAVDQNGLAGCAQGHLIYEPQTSESTLPFPKRLARGGLGSLVVASLTVEHELCGVIVAARRQQKGFTSPDCEFLRQLSGHLALAVHQTQLHEALQHAYDELRETQRAFMQQERLRALGQMASGIAHDINNALSPAALYVQSLLERNQSLDRDAREYITIVQRAIEDVARTVGRMREFYRPRDLDLTLTSLSLNTLLRQVADLTRARWSDMPQERGSVIHLNTELESDVPPVMGSQSEIRDALTNLVLNAVDAMPNGGTLTLRSATVSAPTTRAGQRAGTCICVEVCDTGVGMSDAVRSRCLEPFFTTKGERGTGLGLAMVYGMAQRHGAGVEIDSTPGQGTTVRLIFPVASPQAQLPDAAPAVARPCRILLVDDDPLLLESLRDVLQTDGHTVSVADGGQRGIDEFSAAQGRGAPYDVVITDLGMPNIDGRTVAMAIKSLAPAAPVILLTGWGHRFRAERETPEHVDRVLGKPPLLPELRAALAVLTTCTPMPEAKR